MARWQPARADVLADFAREVLEVHPRGRVVVGVDGIEAPSGDAPADREVFAADLAEAFAGEGVAAATVALTGFVRDPLPADPGRVIDEDAFRSRVLTPFRAGRLEGVEADRAVLVVSGAFLHLGDWAGIWHTSVWLGLPRALAGQRDAARGVDSATWAALVDVAFRRVDARKRANATFDLTDPHHPRREFEDAC